MTSEPGGQNFTAVQVCDIAGITYRQLDYWDRTHLLQASAQPARGSGTRRLYSIADLRCAVALAALSTFANGACSTGWLAVRRLVAEKVRDKPWSPYIVVLDAREVVLCDTAEEVVAAARGGVVATVIQPDRIIWRDDDMNISAESETVHLAASPAAGDRIVAPLPAVGASAVSAP